MFDFEIFILIFFLSLDVLFASFAYGADQIKIPFKSILSITIIVTFLFIFSLFLGNSVGHFLDFYTIKIISFLILFCLSLSKFFEFSIKKYFSKLSSKNFKLFNFNFIVQVINNNTLADSDNSKTLSLKESISLGFVLSLDGMSAAFSTGLMFNNYFLVLISSFSITLFMFLLGNILGKKIKSNNNSNYSWISGIVLLILAITKII